jgi:L-ribulose-5-phosphate 3-epimerase
VARFILSAFADEIDARLERQVYGLLKHDIHYVDLRGINGKNIVDYTPEEAKNIKQHLDAAGIKVAAIGSPIGKIKINDDLERHMKQFENILNIAHVMETKYVRVFSFYIPLGEQPENYTGAVLHRLRAMTEMAQAKGIILTHENEKDIYGDTARRCLYIIKSINSPFFKAVFDPANFIQCGEQSIPDALALLQDYVVYVHIKDALARDGSNVPAGAGDARIKELIVALRGMDYSGFLTLEPHLTFFGA